MMVDLEELKAICAQWWADRLEIDNKREELKQALIPMIQENMSLWVDYDPDDLLLEALHKIGIECRGSFFSAEGIFPKKTGMTIKNGVVEVKEGYGADFITLYP